MCTSVKNGKNGCKGDSGGPLTVLENNRFTVIGVNSFGRKCGFHHEVWARVSEALQWIRSIAPDYQV